MTTGAATGEADIVDTHLHLWDLVRVGYPWLAPEVAPTALMGDLTPIRRNFLAEDYLADARPLGIAQAVHVEANPDPADPLRETRWLQEQADETGFPQAIVAAVDLRAREVASALEANQQSPNVRGVRQALNWTPEPTRYGEPIPDLMSDPRWRAGFALLGPLGLAFDMQVNPDQMPAAAALARSFPETTILLDHMGMPLEHDESGLSLWRRGMRLLAAEPNVAAKISGFGMLDRDWTPKSIRPLVLEVIAIFGTRRIMFGSNYPIENLRSSLKRSVDAIREISGELSKDERLDFFSQNARRLYRLA